MNLIATYNPDVIFGSESWLNPDIYYLANFSIWLCMLCTGNSGMTILTAMGAYSLHVLSLSYPVLDISNTSCEPIHSLSN